MPAEIWVAVVGVLGVIVSSLITGTVTLARARREREDQAERDRQERESQLDEITTAAHRTLYAAYGQILDEMRATLGAAQEEARSAKQAARAAEQRAEEAEGRAAVAEHRMHIMERLLSELRPVLEALGPGAEIWLGQLDRVTALARGR